MKTHPKVAAIIQARMKSTRLPGKVLADIAGHPMLWHVVNRTRQARLVQEVWLATTTEPDDDPVAAYCAAEAIPCFRGSETDVLDRYYQTARQTGAGAVVRITADCPFTDPEVVDKVVGAFLQGDWDYATNILRYTYPDGLDVEVMSFDALECAWKNATLPAEREHVATYLCDSGKFRLAPNVEHTVDLSPRRLCWSVDTPRDLEFARAVFSRLGDRDHSLDSVLRLLEKEPALRAINEDTVSNEGYYLSLAGEPPLPPLERALDASQAMLARAAKVIPTCSQTFSKAPTQFVQGVAPVFIQRGKGCRVWDVDGNEYLDYAMALAPVVLGHADDEVNEAVIRQIQDGTTHSLPHPLEVEVAELLVELIPCAEMVRFGKNGSDATAGAVRVARAFTGREVIAMCGYHGWQDWCIGTTTRNKGVPKAVCDLTKTFAYNDPASLEKIFAEQPGRVAAVIMEAVGVVEPEAGFLQRVKDLAHQNGALLIFDEIVTGFRWSLGGAQAYFDVTPDLACFGKALGNGYPISAVAGRRDVMKWMDEIFFSFTFGGETASLAAARAVLTKMKREPVISHLWEHGQRLKDGFRILSRHFGLEQTAVCLGYGPRTVINFRDANGAESLLYHSLFQQECLKRGVLFTGGQNISYSHGVAEIDRTLRVYRASLETLAQALASDDAALRLEGPQVQPVFRRA